jgi:prepilin-type N-terminal cleavage/methylation domain-containing protein
MHGRCSAAVQERIAVAPQRYRSRAFSLIEMLVVVTIVAILIGLLLPALAGARRQARQSSSLGNLRTIGQVLDQYIGAYAEAFPFTSRETSHPIPCAPGGDVYVWPVWTLDRQWVVVIHEIAPWLEYREVFLSPGHQRDLDDRSRCGLPPSYVYSNSFVARPELWSGSADRNEALIRATRLADVSFPAQKVVFWDGELPYLNRPLKLDGFDCVESSPMLFVDGRAESAAPASASDPVFNPWVDGDQGRMRLHNTRSGARGRDFD